MRKIWDSSLAAMGILRAKRHNAAIFRAYRDRVFETVIQERFGDPIGRIA